MSILKTLTTQNKLALTALLSGLIIFSVLGVEKISAQNYIAKIRITNKTFLSVIITNADAMVYDTSGRPIAVISLLEESIEIKPNSETDLFLRIHLLIPETELETLNGNVRVETDLSYRWLGLNLGYHDSRSVAVDLIEEQLIGK